LGVPRRGEPRQRNADEEPEADDEPGMAGGEAPDVVEHGRRPPSLGIGTRKQINRSSTGKAIALEENGESKGRFEAVVGALARGGIATLRGCAEGVSGS